MEYKQHMSGTLPIGSMQYRITQVHPYFTQEETKEVSESIKNAWVTEGPKCKEFVERMLAMAGAKYAVLAPNGTLALYIALMVLDIGAGDEVIVPDFTMMASASSIYLTGAKPVFVDVSREYLNIDPLQIERFITKKTKAIMPVHQYGQGADMDAILRIAKKHKLLVLEDAAQVVGVYYKKRHLGTFGDLGTFSFFADKTITTGGEGGMVVTNSKRLYEKLRLFRNHGRPHSGTFIHPTMGYNFRITDLQAAVGIAQLRKFDTIKKRKIENDELYKKQLAEVKQITFVARSKDSTFIPFRTNLFAQKLPQLMLHMEKMGIQTRGMFYPLHKQPGFRKFNYQDRDYPNSIYAYKNGMSLPVHFALTKNEIKYICDTIKDFYASQ